MTNDPFDYSELARQAHEFERHINRKSMPIFAMLAFIFLVLPLLALLFNFPNDPPGQMSWKGATVYVGLLGILFSFVVWCCRLPKFPQVCCSNCGIELGHPHRTKIVLATGYCPQCMQPLFTTNASPNSQESSLPSLPTRAEFQRQRAQIHWPTPLIPLLMLVAGGIFIQFIFVSLLKPRLDEFQFLTYQIVVLSSLGLLVIGIIVARSLWYRWQLAKHRCRECGAVIATGCIPLITGNCLTCGARLFSDQPLRPAREKSETPLTMSEVRSRSMRFHRWLGICLIAGILPSLLVLLILAPEDGRRPARLPQDFIYCVGVVLPFLSGIAISQWWLRRSNQVNCPECHHSLIEVSHLVIASRNCPYCLKMIVGP